MQKISTDQVLSSTLDQLNTQVADFLKGNCVFVCSEIQHPLDDIFREAVETIHPQEKKQHLIVLLETSGGHLEVVERMVHVMREHYRKISFVVPSHAYSAGTVLVLSGDEIYMDYYSVLGPIDPQYGGLPGVGYLRKFKEFMEAKEATPQQFAYLTTAFQPEILFRIEQDIKHGESLISDWLPKYKFRNWTKTETRGVKVTAKDRSERAKAIANILGDPEQWHTHSRGIHMQNLQSDEIKLQINDFGSDADLNPAIRNYRNICVGYAQQTTHNNFVHSVGFFRG